MEINLAATTKKKQKRQKNKNKTETTLIVLAEEFVFSRLLSCLMPVEEQDDGNRFTLKVERKVALLYSSY